MIKFLLFALLTALPIIPQPAEVQMGSGTFDATNARCIIQDDVPGLSAEFIGLFAQEFGFSTGKGSGKKITFSKVDGLGPEEYELDIRRSGISVKASDHNGFVYAVQSLRQLVNAGRKIPVALIKDKPRFSYRGMHLDSVRKFFSVDWVKKYIDMLSLHKVNYFHWHLTDDHAWRIEIKKYPELTRTGAFGDIGSRVDLDPYAPYPVEYEGFYSQEEIKDIVRYAEVRGITIIPEIDMPGHMTAALACYPWLGCTGGPYKVINVPGPRGKGLAKDSMCPGRETTFTFIEDVLTEVMEIFPSKYIHIGGDECIKDRWKECDECKALVERLGLKAKDGITEWQQLEVWMINRVANFLEAHGRTAIGWDEILDGDLGKNAVVMSWRGTKSGIKAAQRGYDVIMTPSGTMYFCRNQSKEVREPLTMSKGVITVQNVYDFNPVANLNEEQASHIIGVQACLWADVIGSKPVMEYMLLPRLAALSEVQWCPAGTLEWPRFRESLDVLRTYYDAQGWYYAQHLWGKVGF